MNANTVYNQAYAALEVVCAARSYDINQVIANTEKFRGFDDTLYYLGKLVNAAMNEIQRTAKSTGNIYSAMKKIIANTTKVANQNVSGAWVDSEGWQTVCDGHRLIRTKQHCDGLPACNGMNNSNEIVERTRKDAKYTLTLPTIGNLKVYIADCKRKTPKGKKPDYYYQLTPTYAVDALYLMEMLTVFPVTECKSGRGVQPYYFSTEENGEIIAEGVLMPMKNRYTEANVNE